MNNSLLKRFLRFTLPNLAGMVGISLYILADTLFVANVLGANGLAALNLALPIYSLVAGIGHLLGVGGGIKFSIFHASGDSKNARSMFYHSVLSGLAISAVFVMMGLFCSGGIARLLGGGDDTLGLTATYLGLVFCFSPLLILNNIANAFLRNFGKPNAAMLAMLAGSMANIVLDYVFMYPLGMGMFGAAFASGISPIFGIVIIAVAYGRSQRGVKKQKSRFRFSGKVLGGIIVGGLPALINELSYGITLIVFNFALLSTVGELGVAAYGVVANISLIIVAMLSGVAQGMQPLVSDSFGHSDFSATRKLLSYGLIMGAIIAVASYVTVVIAADPMIEAFDSDKQPLFHQYAKQGLWLYFIGMLPAALNLVMSSYQNSICQSGRAFLLSVLRGFALIAPVILLTSSLWGLTGIWLAFPIVEGITVIVGAVIIAHRRVFPSP